MSDWFLQRYEDGTIAAAERNLPNPKDPQLEFDNQDELVAFCDKKIAEINEEWSKNPFVQTAEKDVKSPVKYTLDGSMLESEYREKENFNFEVDRYNTELQKWQDLKDAALAE